MTCPVVAMRSARWWPWDLPMGLVATTAAGWSGQGVHPLAGECLGEADGVAGGLADVRVVEDRALTPTRKSALLLPYWTIP